MDELRAVLRDYETGRTDRRGLLGALSRLLGGYAAAHLFLEASGVGAGLLAAQESGKQGVESETARYPGPAGAIEAYAAWPRNATRCPGILVIHENRGLNEHIRDVARRFAAEGFVALAPDALSRRGGTGKMKSVEEAREAIGTLTPAEILEDLKAGHRHLEERPAADRQRISSIGFCWGGARSWMLAAEIPSLYRAVVFYGSPPPEEKLAAIRCPVLGIYGEKDVRITSTVEATAAAMKRLGKRFEYTIYPGADHAFFNDTGPRYDQAAAKDAWARTLAFLRA